MRRDANFAEPIELASPGRIGGLALSPDGRIVATVCHDSQPSIELRDAGDGHLLGNSLTGHVAWVDWLEFSPDGKTLASAGWHDGKLGIWDVSTRRPRDLFPAHNGEVCQLAFSPDGATLATCGSDNTVRLWNVARLLEVATLQGHRGQVNGVAFSPDRRWLASASSDGTIQLWLAPTFEEIAATNPK
jgi:WD40 repeat protein